MRLSSQVFSDQVQNKTMSSDQENETMSSDQQTNGNEGSGLSKTLEKKIRRKQIRFQHMIKNDTGIDCFDTPKKVGKHKISSVCYGCNDNFQ